MAKNPLAVIFGCEGTVVAPEELYFFREANPLGFILFARNCVAPEQVRSLVSCLREAVGRADAPVLIDQEGGRVARLKPPSWPAYAAARTLGDMALFDRGRAREAVSLTSALIGADLRALDITVNCAPTVDVPVKGAHQMIGSRAYSTDPGLVAELGAAACEGFFAANVIPVVKHLPGYGRAQVDSHEALPVIEESLAVLEQSDFVPFRALAGMPWGMTAHALFAGLDADKPATLSRTIVQDIIRERIGFGGILVTDDLSMEALEGPLAGRVEAALRAGCDIALHCNGRLDEMRGIAVVAPTLPSHTLGKIAAAEAQRVAAVAFDAAEARQRLKELFASV